MLGALTQKNMGKWKRDGKKIDANVSKHLHNVVHSYLRDPMDGDKMFFLSCNNRQEKSVEFASHRKFTRLQLTVANYFSKFAYNL